MHNIFTNRKRDNAVTTYPLLFTLQLMVFIIEYISIFLTTTESIFISMLYDFM